MKYVKTAEEVNEFVNEVSGYVGCVCQTSPDAKIAIEIGDKVIVLPASDKVIARVLEGIELACKEIEP